MASHLDLDPESPWLHEAESIADATRRNAELSYEDALDFRGAQQEAFEGYLALLTGKTSSSETEHVQVSARAHVQELVAEVVRGIRIFMAGFAPERLAASAAAGVPSKFPPEQALPPTWFQGAGVLLLFEKDPSGAWYVGRKGTSQTLLLTLRSEDHELIGLPLRVGHVKARLPLDISKLSAIEVSVVNDHESKD